MAYHIPIYRAAMAQETFATSLDAKLCILARTARRSFRRASCGAKHRKNVGESEQETTTEFHGIL